MVTSQQPPTKEIDVEFMVFIERYATDLLKWDILTFFANKPDYCASVSTVAEKIGRGAHTVRPELGDLVLLGVLDRCNLEDGQTLYQLTETSDLRRMTLKLGGQTVKTNSR
jgi:hypothetical protein